MGYSRYAWVGNKITEGDMSRLYHLKKATKKHITTMVSEAVRLYLSQHIPAQETSTPLTDKIEEKL
ncbi:hypothetical protein DOJK_00775 [Patescibacteria group bacterium]|nr:hypothetical protein DOJK_00775 [Patescibacteria group bacterium]